MPEKLKFRLFYFIQKNKLNLLLHEDFMKNIKYIQNLNYNHYLGLSIVLYYYINIKISHLKKKFFSLVTFFDYWVLYYYGI